MGCLGVRGVRWGVPQMKGWGVLRGAGGAWELCSMEGCMVCRGCPGGCALWRDVWGTGDALGVVLYGGMCGVQGMPRGLCFVEGHVGCFGVHGKPWRAVWRGVWSALRCIVVQGMPSGLCYMEGCMGCSGLQGMP